MLFSSLFLVVDDITTRDMNVKNIPATIYITVFALDSLNGLHSSLGFDASADH